MPRRPVFSAALVFLALAAVSLTSRSAHADTVIDGGNVINQTWTPAGSPYVIKGDITVPVGSTLTIQPGTVVRMASTDAQGSGSDTARVEIIVKGMLSAVGTAANPITFQGQTSSAGIWYGLDVADGATAAIAFAAISHARYGLRSASSGLTVTDTSITGSSVSGVLLTAGTPTFTRLSVADSSQDGFSVTGTAGPTLTDSVLRNNGPSSYAGLRVTSSTATTVKRTTIVGSYYGVYASGSSTSLSIEGSIIANHNYYGIYRASGSVSVASSNVWNNNDTPSAYNFYNSPTVGAGMISANPLFVSATNLRLTSNSPSRYGAEGSLDQGGLPYTSDATPGLVGTLWTSTQLTTANSPYTVTGDLTVAPGVTLTIDPGVKLAFASSDLMGSGSDTSRAELISLGKLVATGTSATPITLESTTASSGTWYGIRLAGAGTATLAYVNQRYGRYGLTLDTSAAVSIAHVQLWNNSVNGLLVQSGTPALDALSIQNSSQDGVSYTGSAGGSLTNALIANNGPSSYAGLRVTSSTAVQVTNATITGSYYGVYASGSSTSLTLSNSIVVNHNYYGIYRASGSVSVASSDVWNNNDTPSAYNFYNSPTVGAGMLATNPQFVSVTDFHLKSGSSCIDAGTSTGAPKSDLDGAARPLDGDGINGAAHDMGAYEFVAAAFCGDGTKSGTEQCDEGVANGTYGHCKADCSGPGPRCGDGTTNGPEQCDDGNASNTDSCTSSCQTAKCGDGFVQPGEDCDDGNQIDTDACPSSCKTATCGNGKLEAGEQCDDGNQSNTDACLTTCKTAKCGDGFVGPGESCDDGNQVDSDACSNTCQSASCGDGIVQPGEECDDGNTNSADGCVNGCKKAACGDGFVQLGIEQCDDGNQNDTDACSNACKKGGCGDGKVQAGEECDDGNADNTDGCLVSCVKATCGDGFVQAGVEACDDGNSLNTDACLSTCKTAACGDGFVQLGTEQCDDGNDVDSDSCTNSCKKPGCGDGITGPGEECDDGNASNTDACLTTCVKAHCGDGAVEAGVEECDDGNGIDIDGCSNACQKATCGDGVQQVGEDCDDGNTTAGDGCSASCQTESNGAGGMSAGGAAGSSSEGGQGGTGATSGSAGTTSTGGTNAGGAGGANAGGTSAGGTSAGGKGGTTNTGGTTVIDEPAGAAGSKTAGGAGGAAGSGTTPAPEDTGSDGGCAVSATGERGTSAAGLALAGLAALVAGRRRRRSA